MDSSVPLVKLTGIHKRFGAVHSLRGVDLDVMPGETYGLLGDNAAGKSTLMKVLTGVYQPDAGTIELDGVERTFGSPAVSRSAGIEMIYQDFALSDNLDVRANIFLGREPRKRILGPFLQVVDNKATEREAKRVLDQLDIEINPRLKVRRLSGGQRQAVAIGRALAFDARLVVMDEPTANLSVAKVDKLIEVTGRLKQLGIAVIIITHRLDEAFAVADRISVMRQGSVVGRFATPDVTESEVAHLISHGSMPVDRPDDRVDHGPDALRDRSSSAPSGRRLIGSTIPSGTGTQTNGDRR